MNLPQNIMRIKGTLFKKKKSPKWTTPEFYITSCIKEQDFTKSNERGKKSYARQERIKENMWV